MTVALPVGLEDFRKLRMLGVEYVDKTHMVRTLLDKRGTEVFLLPRPRRFGKTLNLSMLRYFFERSQEDRAPLFHGLSIWQAGGPYREHFARYPVISVSFKGIKQDRPDQCILGIREKLQAVYDEHRALLDDGALKEDERPHYRSILDGSASDAQYQSALLRLCRYLHRQSGQPVVVLIDEYDEPIHTAYHHGFAPEILPFYRVLLAETLKGNPHLFKGVLTGILRVARETIFSDLNNLSAYSLLRSEFNTSFGFTEEEVVRLLERLGRPELLDGIRAWYNGYVFGGITVYNPWSLMSYHGFVTGLLALLEPDYQVRSNRESGSGRPDVLILPAQPGKPGVALELKVARPGRKTPERALEEGLAQIRHRGYTAESEARGATPIHCFAVALRGKQVWVKKAPRRAASGRRDSTR